MQIRNSTIADTDYIFRMYKMATEYQKTKFHVHWPVFDRDLVLNEITESRQWKLIEEHAVACIWATTFNDPQIWEDMNGDPAVYIHRIATNPEFRGRNMVQEITNWAKEHAVANNKQFVRMDTVGHNQKLIEYYQKCGFDYLGFVKLKNTDGLPLHYDNASVCLFQLEVK